MKIKSLHIITIVLTFFLNIACSTEPSSDEPKCNPEDVDFVKKNVEDEINNLVEASLKDYLIKVDDHWQNMNWWKRLWGVGESHYDTSNRTWESTGFYENFENIINSNLDDANVIVNSENNTQIFEYNEDTQDLKENINAYIYEIYDVKDPNYFFIYSFFIEEWVLFIISYFIALILVLIFSGGDIYSFVGALPVAVFLEVIVFIVYFFWFMPDENQFVKEQLTDALFEAKAGIKLISEEILDEKFFSLCE